MVTVNDVKQKLPKVKVFLYVRFTEICTKWKHNITMNIHLQGTVITFQFEQFVVNVVHAAFSFDGLATSHPVYVPVYNPSEINEVFDAISYDKVRK